MSLLVLGSIAGVAEGLVAGAVLADKGPLPGVAPGVDLEVLQAREAPRAALYLEYLQHEHSAQQRWTIYHLTHVGLLAGVDPHVRHELVLGVEGPRAPAAAVPQTRELLAALPAPGVSILQGHFIVSKTSVCRRK